MNRPSQRIRRLLLAIRVVAFFLAAACGSDGDRGESTRVPSATELAGTYDVTFDTGVQTGGSLSLSLGAAGLADNGTLRVTLFPGREIESTLEGAVQSDGSIELEGSGHLSDFGFEMSGRARVEERQGVLRVFGTLDAAPPHTPRLVFTMERPVNSDASVFGGRYLVSFPVSPGTCHCPSTAEVTLDVAAEGTGSTLDADERDVSGLQVGKIAAGACLVSPQGRLRLRTLYETPPGGGCGVALFGSFAPCSLTLIGVLPHDADGAEGAGHFVVAEAPFNIAVPGGEGDWSSTRLVDRTLR